MNIEIDLRALGQIGLEDIDSTKKTLVDFIIYRSVVNLYIEKFVKKMKDEGYSKEMIMKISGLKSDEFGDI